MSDKFRMSDVSVRELVERTATSSPVPGGGSAAAVSGALGAALVHMVVELTSGRPAAADDEHELTEIRVSAASCQSELLRLAEVDAAAYDSVVRARRMPRETDREREARQVQLNVAVREATLAPLHVARRAAEVRELAGRLAPIANRHAISDVGVAALLATAALRGAALNVRINLPYVLDDEQLRVEAGDEITQLLEVADERLAGILEDVEERMA